MCCLCSETSSERPLPWCTSCSAWALKQHPNRAGGIASTSSSSTWPHSYLVRMHGTVAIVAILGLALCAVCLERPSLLPNLVPRMVVPFTPNPVEIRLCLVQALFLDLGQLLLIAKKQPASRP